MKKTVKGMTLIEVIISMLIFTLLAAIMVEAGSVTKSLIMNTNHLNNKTTAESPVGTVRDVEQLEELASEATMPLETTPVTIRVGTYSTVNADKYSTAAAAAVAQAAGKNCTTNMDGHLEFYVIEATEAPTEEPTT